jgi:hypothetical protein
VRENIREVRKEDNPLTPDKMATVRTPTAGTKPSDKTPSPRAGQSSVVRRSIGSIEEKLAKATGAVESRPQNRLQEAKNLLQSGRRNLDQSRNMRSDLRENTHAALTGLYNIIKDIEGNVGKTTVREKTLITKSDEKVRDGTEKIIQKMMNEREEWTKEMRGMIRGQEERERKWNEWRSEHMEKMNEMKDVIREHCGTLQRMTYAGAVASKPKLDRRETLHSVVVTAKDVSETSEQVLGRIRSMVRAKEGGTEVEQVRRTKDRKVIVSCKTKSEREGVKKLMERKGSGLVVEEVQNRDPMVVLRDVLKITPNEEIYKTLRAQNRALFEGLDDENARMQFKYERRARNPHARHIVLAVAPSLWSRALELGAVRLDLQRVRVEDQSPLVQCSICLGYGHGRKFCKETTERCSHCGGSHLRAECEVMLAGLPPSCTNCCAAKMRDVGHNAFDAVCPIRKRWDAIARSRVAYC